LGLAENLTLGNLDARRDWGRAREYVEAMWLMLQQDQPDDYVIATGETHTVKEFLELTFEYLDLDYRKYLVLDDQFRRPAEVNYLLGDCSKAREKLGWEYNLSFADLVHEMVQSDLDYYSRTGEAVALPSTMSVVQ